MILFRPPGSLVRPGRRALQMLKQLVGSENYCLVEARSGLDARRPSGHAAVPVDEHPCDFLRCQQRSRIQAILENRIDLRAPPPIFMSSKVMADQNPVMSP